MSEEDPIDIVRHALHQSPDINYATIPIEPLAMVIAEAQEAKNLREYTQTVEATNTSLIEAMKVLKAEIAEQHNTNKELQRINQEIVEEYLAKQPVESFAELRRENTSLQLKIVELRSTLRCVNEKIDEKIIDDTYHADLQRVTKELNTANARIAALRYFLKQEKKKTAETMYKAVIDGGDGAGNAED